MTCITAVGIYDDFASSKACISLRSANNETSCWVDEIFSVLIQQFSWNDRQDYMFFDVFLDLFQCSLFSVLSRHNDCIHTYRLVTVVFNRYLCFTIRTKIFQCTVLTHFRQTACDTVG
ncbi:hypothetical protein D3C76_1177900 [compost metagenome]